jgi:hypothetical protein
MSIKTTGRLVGALFLLAFVCYGTGSTALTGSAAGYTLEFLNSGIVLAIAILVFFVLNKRHAAAARIYLVARSAEAALLGVGVVLLMSEQSFAAGVAYQLGMFSLGLGSIAFLTALMRQRMLPAWLGIWGLGGYVLVAAGTIGELAGWPIGLALSAPGGLFEIVLGITLLYSGFPDPKAARVGPATDRIGAVAVATGEARTRRAGLLAGIGLLLMAILAGLANFGVIQRFVTSDAAQTTRGLLANQLSFALAIAGLFVVAGLDLVVAWALRAFFAPDQPRAALTAALLRTAYAVVFIVAISHLLVAAILVHHLPGAGSGAVSAHVSDQVRSETDQFANIWQLALILFAAHLLLVAWLALRSGRVPRVVAALVAVAGAGYLADSVGPLVWAGYTIQLTSVTFVGEVVLMIWLLAFAARRRARTPLRPSSERTEQPQLV